MKGNQAVGLKKNATEPHWVHWDFKEICVCQGCLTIGKWPNSQSLETLWVGVSASPVLDLQGPFKLFGNVHLCPAPFSQAPPGPACANAPAWSQNATPQKGYSSVPSTYHHLCRKHVLVSKLKVPHFLEDHLLVFPGLKEVCTSENCGVTRGFMPFNVDGVWLVIGINSPGRGRKGKKKNSCYHHFHV